MEQSHLIKSLSKLAFGGLGKLNKESIELESFNNR